MTDVVDQAELIARDAEIARLVRIVFEDLETEVVDVMVGAVLTIMAAPDAPDDVLTLCGVVDWCVSVPLKERTRRLLVCALVAELKGD